MQGEKKTDCGLWRGLIVDPGNVEITAWDVSLDRKLIYGIERDRKSVV